MKVRALRGVCIGVDRHLVPNETADLPAAEVQFLESIGAVERVIEPVVEPAVVPDTVLELTPAEVGATDPVPESEPPAKAGSKKKE